MEPGPNSFEQILTRYIYQVFLGLAVRYSIHTDKRTPFLTREVIATYSTYGLVNTIRDWLLGNSEVSAEELAESYQYLLSHSVLDLLHETP